ncbi:MAG TPA: vWA domain-containing protein [Clostridia bacterium]|nr:vWA domain-containing protein [Clostridia bacterium]
MKKDLTELVFILDRSGSMSGLERDTIGGFNEMIGKQKAGEGNALVTTVLFDDEYELLHDRVDLGELVPLSDEDYFVRGTTALLDAVGKTISRITDAQRRTAEEKRAERVMFVITTDGMENASREYGYEKVRKMVEYQKSEFGWEFIFLGANIDAVAEAVRFGIGKNRAANFRADSTGTSKSFYSLGEAVSNFREKDCISEKWSEAVDEDYEKRD